MNQAEALVLTEEERDSLQQDHYGGSGKFDTTTKTTSTVRLHHDFVTEGEQAGLMSQRSQGIRITTLLEHGTLHTN